jgi:RsiW-degrading membrane proteinase PrsW (M82 family)
VFCAYCGRGIAPAAGFCGACGRSAGTHSLLGDFIDEVSGSLREIVLVDKMTRSEILRSPVFRFVFLVAMGPLAIALLPGNRAILHGLAIYSALLWALLLYRLFADRHLPFRWAIGVVLFSCFVMVPALEFYLWLPPHIIDPLIAGGSLPVRLAGYVLGVGVREELCKAAPLLALAVVSARMRRPLNGLVLGMMSGVGFAAAENVYYVYRTVSQAASLSAAAGEHLVMPVYNNVVRMAMGPFVHGCLSGIFGYFIGLAARDPQRRAVFVLAGLGLSSLLHGLYDTGVTTSPVLGLAVQALTYFLLMTYVLKARGLASAREIGGGVFNRTVMVQLPPGAFAAAGVTTVPPPPRRPVPRGPFAWRLRGVAGPPAGLTFNLSGEIRLGRDGARCALHVDEPAVSREHAVLSPDGERRAWRIRRVSTKAPLYLNGLEVQEARLTPGDQIQVGTWVLVLEVA